MITGNVASEAMPLREPALIYSLEIVFPDYSPFHHDLIAHKYIKFIFLSVKTRYVVMNYFLWYTCVTPWHTLASHLKEGHTMTEVQHLLNYLHSLNENDTVIADVLGIRRETVNRLRNGSTSNRCTGTTSLATLREYARQLATIHHSTVPPYFFQCSHCGYYQEATPARRCVSCQRMHGRELAHAKK